MIHVSMWIKVVMYVEVGKATAWISIC